MCVCTNATPIPNTQDRETGSVSAGVYVEYFSGATRTRWGGALLGLGIVFVFGLAQTFRVLLDLWLTKMAGPRRSAGRTRNAVTPTTGGSPSTGALPSSQSASALP